MAKVEMDLAELKQLENKIENLEKEKQDLIDRQQQVIIYHKYFNGRIKPGKAKSGVIIENVQILGSYNNFGQRDYFNQTFDINRALETGLIEIDLTEDSSKHTKDYKNLSEVVSEIRQEEENKVKDLLDKTLARATEAEYNLSIINESTDKRILSIRDSHKKEIEKLTKSFETKIEKKDEELKKLRQEFEDFKEDKKRISLEEQVKILNTTLHKLQNRTFWQRIFNK